MRSFTLPLFALLFTASVHGQSGVPPEVSSVITGGYWKFNGQSGQYRVVVASQGWEHITSRVVVEWLAEPTSSSQGLTVVATQEPTLPFGQSTASLSASLKSIAVGCVELRLSGVVTVEPSRKVSAAFLVHEPGRVEPVAANPSVKGTSCGKPQAAPYLER